MMALSKEVLRPSPEEQAEEAVEGYIERVEKKPEIDSDVAAFVKPIGGQVTMPGSVGDDFGQTVMQQAASDDPAIVLPLTEEEVRDGLHHRVIDSLRWLAEWSVKLIKKYPGKVFYQSESS